MAKEGNLAQKTYQQVSQQNGSTFAQMLKKYDKSILDLPNIGEILAYAGKDVVGTLFFLDTLKENPNVFEEYAFDSKAEPYFDDELIELFIQRAKEIRQMEGNYPKSSKVAQEILSIYKENRRQKLAKAKGVRLEEIKNAELFVPLKEEQDQFPLNTFIKQGDPSYVIFYLLNTMVSSEIEFLKKKGDGISARSLNTKSIKEELSGSLKRFMGKYHYEQGQIFRFNVEKNGVYFMDDAVLKEGKVIHFDPKKYFMADGLIVDLEKNEILNLAGVEAEKVKPLNEKIKGKKLSLKEEKGLRILLADDKEVIVAKEGRKLSPFELIARKKGKRYAEAIRREDSCIFDIPNLLDIVEYAAKDVTPYLIEYLQSLKPRVEDKFESDMDTLVHLFMAGYVPCYSPKLTEKYIQKVNALAPIQVDENGVKQVSVPKEIAISLAESYRQEKRELLAKLRGCNLEDISDLDVLTVTSLAEKNMITPYYRSDEAICTLKDDNRHLSQYMINAVKRNVDEIKRENFLNPRREDEYGTSVISIQVPRNGGNISIKNRYNHTLDRVSGENPDNTFNSNPDNISEGMLSAMERELPVALYTSRAWPPHSHVSFGEDSRLFYYDYEVYGVYFAQNHYLKNGQVGNLKDCYELNCGYLTKEGDLLCTDLYDGSREIVDVLKNEAKGEKLRWETKEELTHIYAGDRLVAKLKGKDFVGLYLNKTMHLPRNFMEDAPLLEEVIAPSVVHMDGSVFKNAPNLKKVELPNCLYAGANSLSMAKEADVNAPFVFEAGANNQLKARQVPSMTLYSLLVNYPKEFENKKLKMKYHHGQYDIYADGKIVAEIGHADGLIGLYLNYTDTLGYGQLSQLQTLVAPLVEKIPYSTFGGDCSILKRLELPNCCYMLSTPEDGCISKFSREKCQIIAPYVYNEKDGFLKGCILRKLDPDINMNEKTEMFFNKYFKDKKVTIEEEENQKYLCVNGERLITYDKTRNKISGVLLPEIEEINLEVLNEECFSLRSLSLPDVKRIASTGNELSKIVNCCLDHLSIPKVEDLGNKGIFLLKGYKKLKIDFNKEAVEKAGVFFFNDVIFDSKQGIFVETTFKRDTFAGLLNQNIKNSADFNFEPPKITVVQKGEKTSIMINGEEMVAFEKGDVVRLNLAYVKDMPMWTIKYFDKLQEITMENLERMGNGSVISCEKLKKINFPKLMDVSRYCFDNLGVEEISLPSVKYIDSSCFSSLRQCSKIKLPSLKYVDMNSSFERDGFYYSENIETDYFKNKNQIFFAGILIDLDNQTVKLPSGTTKENFCKMLETELKEATITVEEKEGVRFLCADGRPVIREEEGNITGLYLEKAETISLNIYLPKLREVEALNAIKIEKKSCQMFPDLERFVANNVTEIEEGCFKNNYNLKELSLKNVQYIGDDCFSDIPNVENLMLNNLKSCGDKCFTSMSKLKNMQAVRLEKAGAGSFDATHSLEILNSPLLQNRLELFKHHCNRRAILKSMREKGFLRHIMHSGALAK